MANFLVLRSDSQRNIDVIGKANLKEDAQSILKNDFKELFFQKVGVDAITNFEQF